jgi:uncharacterized protein YgiB involved in biofilm formation
MKRSKRLVLTTMMAGGGLSLAACGDNPPAATQWGDPPAAAAPAQVGSTETYQTLADCRLDDKFTDQQCEQSFAAAQAENDANAPRFSDQPTCEEQFGAGNCVQRSQGATNFFVPFLAGYVVAEVVDEIGDAMRYRGRPYYRDRYGSYYLPGGRRLTTNYVTGRPQITSDALAPSRATAPTRTQSRSAVISRGGFGGGGGRSFGG